MLLARLACVVALAVALGTGCTVDKRLSQAQLDAIQMRELDVGADRAYQAVVGVMFEQGYQIMESDLEGGLLVASLTTGDTMSGFRTSLLQITVAEMTQTTASVRISTSADGQTRLDEPTIRRLHERVDVHARTPITDVVWEPTR
jgi:hypothetical protein